MQRRTWLTLASAVCWVAPVCGVPAMGGWPPSTKGRIARQDTPRRPGIALGKPIFEAHIDLDRVSLGRPEEMVRGPGFVGGYTILTKTPADVRQRSGLTSWQLTQDMAVNFHPLDVVDPSQVGPNMWQIGATIFNRTNSPVSVSVGLAQAGIGWYDIPTSHAKHMVRCRRVSVRSRLRGNGRLVWGVDIDGGEHIQNQQNSSHNDQEFPVGWIHFPKPSRHGLAER